VCVSPAAPAERASLIWRGCKSKIYCNVNHSSKCFKELSAFSFARLPVKMYEPMKYL
jgi:hypothetical protein